MYTLVAFLFKFKVRFTFTFIFAVNIHFFLDCYQSVADPEKLFKCLKILNVKIKP